MKISIITINYNNKSGLEATLKSVFTQSDLDFEYIIIDGGSTDGSFDLIKEQEQQLTAWLSEKDEGIYDAMNKGINIAKGDYLIFLNSGDCFYNNDIIKCYKENIVKFPQVDIFYSNIIVVNDEKFGYDWVNIYPSKLGLDYFKCLVINQQATLVKSSLFFEIGKFPLEYKLASDYWLWIKCLLNSKKFMHINLITVSYDNGGVSGTNFSKYAEEMKIIWKSLLPDVVKDLLDEYEQQKQLSNYRIVKAAIAINRKYQKLKELL